MTKIVLSEVELKLYNYIKDKKETTFESIKKDLGDKFLGAIGRLIQKDLILKSKKATEHISTGYTTVGIKYIKTLKLKEE